MKGFFPKLKDLSPKLKVFGNSVALEAAKSVKKAWIRANGVTVYLIVFHFWIWIRRWSWSSKWWGQWLDPWNAQGLSGHSVKAVFLKKGCNRRHRKVQRVLGLCRRLHSRHTTPCKDSSYGQKYLRRVRKKVQKQPKFQVRISLCHARIELITNVKMTLVVKRRKNFAGEMWYEYLNW